MFEDFSKNVGNHFLSQWNELINYSDGSLFT